MRERRSLGRKWRGGENVDLCLMAKHQGRVPRSHGLVETRSDSGPQTSLNFSVLGEESTPGGWAQVGERHSGHHLLSGSTFRIGSWAPWERLVSSLHCIVSFRIHINAARDYIFHLTRV